MFQDSSWFFHCNTDSGSWRRCCSSFRVTLRPASSSYKIASAWPAAQAMLVTQRRETSVCQDCPQGHSHKKAAPRESCFFRGLDRRDISMPHRVAIPLCNTTRFELPGVRRRCCVTSKFDIFCHLSIFFLTSTFYGTICAAKHGRRGVRSCKNGENVVQ